MKKAATIFFYDALEIKEKENINYEIQFNASSHWITKFKRKHKFSRRKFRRKRRSSTSLSKVITFFKQLQNILNTAEFRRIINVNETCWHIEETGEYTWAQTGSDSVAINSDVDEKANFTCLATIDANGTKYDLVLIVKGATERVEGNWFGKGRHIIKEEANNNEIELLESPFQSSRKSKRCDEEKIILSQVGQHIQPRSDIYTI